MATDDFIPDSQFKPDAAPVKNVAASTGGASSPDFIPDSQFQSDDERYGNVGQTLAATAEGAARGASLGISDKLEQMAGISDAASIRGRKEASPIASGLGNIAGTAGLIALTGGIAAPIEGAAAIPALGEAAAVAGKGLIGAGVNPVIAAGLGYGAEGATLGLGNVISDKALGDPNLNASKIASEIGLGLVLGGGLGALGEGVANKVKGRGFFGSKIASTAEEASAGAQTAEALNSKAGANGFEYPKADPGLKPNAQDISHSAEYLQSKGIDAPIAEGMVSGNKWVQWADDAVSNGAPTYAGIRRARIYEKASEAVKAGLNDALDTGTEFGGGEMSARQLGESMQSSLSGKIDQMAAPAKALYEELKPHYESIPIDKSALSDVVDTISNMREARVDPGSPEGLIANRVVKALGNLDSIEDLKYYKTALNRQLSATASPAERHIMGVISDHLADLEEGSILRAAKNPNLPLDAAASMEGLIAKRKLANAEYKPFIQKVQNLSEQLGKKKIGGAQSAINFIQHDLDPEDLASRLFSKKYSKFNEFFAKEFPQESAMMRMYQKQQMTKAATVGGVFSPARFFTSFEKLEPEVQKAIFSADELATIRATKVYSRAIPKNFNPSGTAHMVAIRGFFESPTGAILSNARDLALEAFIKTAGAMPEAIRPNPFIVGQEAAEKLNQVGAAQKVADQANDRIYSKVGKFFGMAVAKQGDDYLSDKKKDKK